MKWRELTKWFATALTASALIVSCGPFVSGINFVFGDDGAQATAIATDDVWLIEVQADGERGERGADVFQLYVLADNLVYSEEEHCSPYRDGVRCLWRDVDGSFHDTLVFQGDFLTCNFALYRPGDNRLYGGLCQVRGR